MFKKIFFFLFWGSWILIKVAYCQDFKKKQQTADSLFAVGKYYEAETLYAQILNEGVFSEKNILKQAFVASQQKNYAAYLHYLNLHLQYKPSLRTAQKIYNIATAYELEGYEVSDSKWLLLLYYAYHKWLVWGFCLLLLVWVFVFLRKKYHSWGIFQRNGIFLLIVLTFGIFFINFMPNINEAIVAYDHTYLMKAPSAASSKVAVLSKGKKLSVVAENDVWLEVIWQKEKAFVRKTQVYFHPLF
ncbi:MAG: hypothetical protein RMJ97_01830 [Raineya sp.]|nr:hypothetical protein [Raineya sp.]MDW8295599.1 hypothetical protein [Raineya sp.]